MTDHTDRPAEPVPPDAANVQALRFDDDGVIPNNPDLPALIVRGAVPTDAGTEAIKALLHANGWRRVWDWTVFDYQHYHPDAHEVLVVAGGWADLNLGGPTGPTLRVIAGDVLILPAGTGHCRVAEGGGFRVCGAYPPGQEDREIVRGLLTNRRDAPARIRMVPRPRTDPIWGDRGPVLDRWGRD